MSMSSKGSENAVEMEKVDSSECEKGSRSGSVLSAVSSLADSTMSKEGLSVMLTAAFLVAQMAGSGILALPRAMADTGWIGIVLIMIFGLNVGFSGNRLGQCWVMLEERWPEYRAAVRQPYPAIGYRAFGNVGRIIVVIAMLLTQFGVSVVFLILSAQLMASLLESVAPELTVCWLVIILACIITPGTWLGTPKDFWWISVLAMGATVLACVVILVTLIVDAEYYPEVGGVEPEYPNPTFNSFFLGFGAILFSFGGASAFPTIQNDMKDRSLFHKSVTIGFGILMLMYIPVSVAGYAVIGDAVSSNVLFSITGTAVEVTKAAIVVHLLTAYFIVSNPVGQALEDMFNVPNNFNVKRVALRTSLVVLQVIIGLAVPDFGLILDLIGGSTNTLLSFVMPPLLYMRLVDNTTDPKWPVRKIPRWMRIYMWEITLIGVVGGISSTVIAIIHIASPDSFSTPSCFIEW